MYIVYVKHYLNNKGIQYVDEIWFPKVFEIMRKQDGYISLLHDAKRDINDCINVIVTFDSKESLEKWAEHEDHDALVNELDKFRCRDYWEFACANNIAINYDELEWEKVQ